MYIIVHEMQVHILLTNQKNRFEMIILVSVCHTLYIYVKDNIKSTAN